MTGIDLSRLNVGGINNDNSQMTPPSGWGQESEEKVKTEIKEVKEEAVAQEVKSELEQPVDIGESVKEESLESFDRTNILQTLSQELHNEEKEETVTEVVQESEKIEESIPKKEIVSEIQSPKPIIKSSKGKFIYHTRLDAAYSNRPTPLIVKTVFSRTLMNLLNTYFNGAVNKDGEIHRYVDDELKFFGVYNRKKASCIWEEGGADESKGSVLLVTDPAGNPLTPSFSLSNTNVVNGKHALVPVWVGCFILMGGQRKGEEILTVYEITDIETSADARQMIPVYGLKLICYGNGEEINSNVDSTIWNADSPAWKVAMKRMYEKHAFVPAYVNDYKEFILDENTLNDLNDALGDEKFIETIQTASDIKTAYKDVGDKLGRSLLKLQKHECAQLIVYPVDHQEYVDVWVLGIIYDRDTHSSVNRRIAYERVVLREDDACQFFYPDRTEKESVPFDTLSKALKRNNGFIINAFRRLTPVI